MSIANGINVMQAVRYTFGKGVAQSLYGKVVSDFGRCKGGFSSHPKGVKAVKVKAVKVKAVIEACGRQYCVEPNMELDIDLIDSKEGEKVEFSRVLLIRADGKTIVGSPYIDGAKVTAQVVKHHRGRKIIVFKYRPKKRYRRKRGHRQWFTKVKVLDISLPSELPR